MAGETELERIVVRLIGDGSSFHKMMTGAAVITQKTTTQMITALNRVEGFANTLLGTFGSLGIAASLKGAFDQFAKMERGQIRLNAVIQGNGGNVANLTARYREVAEAISSVTLNTKGEILSLFQQAEAAQMSGDAAENVVRNSVALAGATGSSAESMFRAAMMIQRGHPEYAKRILQLRGVADGQELVDAITKKMGVGMAVLQAEFNSASGRMERLGRSLKSVGVEVGGLIASFLLPAAEFVQKLTEQFKLLDASTKKVTYQVVGLTLAFLGMGPVTSVLKGLLNPIIALARYLAITLPLAIANMLAWTAWSIAVLVVKSAVMLVNISLAVFNGLLIVSKVLTSSATLVYVTWGAVILALKASIWLVNAALVAMNLLLAPATLFTIVGVVGILGAGFAVVSGAIAGIVGFAKSMVALFGSFSQFTGPIQHIFMLFGEWGKILRDIVAIARVDLPAAWKLAGAAFEVVMLEIQQLFPPLWKYIRGGFEAVWKFVGDQLAGAFDDMVQKGRIAVLQLKQSQNEFFGGSNAERQQKEIDGLLEGMARNQRTRLAESVRQIDRSIAELNAKFKVTPTPELDKARRVLTAERDRARELIARVGQQAAGPAIRAGEVIGSAVKEGVEKSVAKIDVKATLFGSAEALSKIAEYADRFREGNARGAIPIPSTRSLGGLGGASGEPVVVGLLRDIRASNRRIADRPPVELDSADLDGV